MPGGRRERTRYPGIYRLTSGLYQCVFRADGRQRSQAFRTLEQARRFQSQTRAALDRGDWVDPKGGRVPFSEWVEYWLTTRRVQPTTAAKDKSRLTAHILPRFGTMMLGRITPAAVRAWVRDLEGQGLARGTVEGVYALLAQVMRDAEAEDLIARSPCRGVKLDPSRPPSRTPRVLTTVEANRLLEALQADRARTTKQVHDQPAPPPAHAEPGIQRPVTPTGRLAEPRSDPDPAKPSRANAVKSDQRTHDATPYTLVLTALGTGLRWGELAGLRRRNIHLLARPPYLEVVESLHEASGRLWFGPPKTRSSRRRVPLPAAVAQALAAHLPPNGGPDDRVFTSPRGTLLRRHNFYVQTWRPALVAAGLEGFHVHDLRHTTASWLADAGIPEVIIAALLGHKVGRTQTAGYVQVVSGFEGRVLAVLDERLQGVEVGRRVGG